MKHYCPMCGEQWNEDVCASCGWFEGKRTRYSQPRPRRIKERLGLSENLMVIPEREKGGSDDKG